MRARYLPLVLLLFSTCGFAGAPRWIAGSQFKARVGKPLQWQGPNLLYFVDRGDLSPSVSHDQAVQMVDTAIQTWNIPYSSLNILNGGSLDEDVNENNVFMASTGVVFPADVKSSNYASKNIAVIFDATGAVTDLLLGSGSSDPLYCRQNNVTESVDLFLTNTGYIGHAIIVLNGRCTGLPEQLLEMRYQLIRKFGRVLGLGWSQCNDNVFTGTPTPTYQQAMHWPLMHPIDILCGPYAYQCLPSPFTLREDDIASLVYLYPATAGNGKISPYSYAMGLYGILTFPNGQGMRGVNIVVHVRPQFWNTVLPWETTSSPTGAGFVMGASTPITSVPSGMDAAMGTTENPAAGYWNLTRIPNFTHGNWETYVVTGEPVNPLYTGQYAVGSYRQSQVTPSGNIYYSSNIVVNSYYGWAYFNPTNAASVCNAGSDGTERSPATLDATGWWTGQMCGWNHASWLTFNAPANRTFTLEVTAQDENGSPTSQKLMPVTGLWKTADSYGTLPTAAAIRQAFNSTAAGVTLLQAGTTTPQSYRLSIADQRGDGRPDFNYKARLLILDAVSPAQLPASGGTLTLTGRGFRTGTTVLIGAAAATVLSTNANQIVVTAPPLSKVSGAAIWTGDVTVLDPSTGASTTAASALSYVNGTVTLVSDELILVSGGSQSIASNASFSKLVLQVTDGAGNNLPGAAVQVHQTLTGYAPICTSPGRCPVPPIFGTVSASMVTDSSGRVEIVPLEIAGAEVTQMVATAGKSGYLSTRLEKTP